LPLAEPGAFVGAMFDTGEHTAEVFADWLGISAADLKSLHDEGVV